MQFDRIDTADLARPDQSKLLNGILVPRPIAWVSTIGAKGVNLAPFSYFTAVSVQPMIVMFSVSVPFGDRAGTTKDTLQNIDEIPEFVVHLVDRDLAGQMNATSAELPRGTNEFDVAGLTQLPSTKIRPPRIAEAGVHLECTLFDSQQIGDVPYRMIFGEVVAIHCSEGIVNDRFHVNQDLHRPIGRLGGASQYTTPNDRFTIQDSHIKSG